MFKWFKKFFRAQNSNEQNSIVFEGWSAKVPSFNEISEFVKNLNDSPDDFRPIDFGYSPFIYGGVLINKQAYLPYMYNFSEMLVYNSDVLRTVVRVIVWEAIRNGVYVKERFVSKCEKCGAEYNEPVSVCEVCGSRKLRGPDKYEKYKIEKWIKRVNFNNQSIIEVLEDVSWNLNIFDNAYVVIRKKYKFDKNGRIVGAEPIEVISGDVKSLFLLINNDGKLGYDDEGNMLFVCPVHRRELVKVPEEKFLKEGYVKCPICGRECLQAFVEFKRLASGLTGVGQSVDGYYLARGEVLHIKKFTPGVGYGYPMPLTIAIKVMVLMKMDAYVLAGYSLGRPPKGLLILKGNRDSIAKAWEYVEEMSRRNPWMIVPLVIEGYEKYSGKVAEWIDLSLKMDEPSLIQYRDELRRSIGACYGVMPMFQGDLSTGVGLANEGLQITVTNRTVENEHRIMNEILEWICKEYGFNNYKIIMKPHEEKDLMAQLQRIDMRLRIAKELIGLGYNVQIVEGVDGIEFKLLDSTIDDEAVRKIRELAQKYGININISDEELKELIIELLKNPDRVKNELMNQNQSVMSQVPSPDNEIKDIRSKVNEELEIEDRKEEIRERKNRNRRWKRLLEALFGGDTTKRTRAVGYGGELTEKYPSEGRLNESRKYEGHPDVEQK